VIVACEGDFFDCNGSLDDGCEARDLGLAATPVQVTPKIGAYTGSLHARDTHDTLRPEFSWLPVAPAGCGVVTYHLQVDDSCDNGRRQACEFPSPELDEAQLTEPRFAPSDDLPVEEVSAPLGRRYFWRVRACDDVGRCSSWSEVRYVDVGRLKADLTGDGYADIVALDEYGFPVVFYQGAEDFGESDPVGVLPSIVFNEELWWGEEFYNVARLRLLGDVNGDGFNDFGAPGPTATQSGTDQQVMYVFLGAAEPSDITAITFEITADVNDPAVYSAADFDGDGFADLLLAASAVEGLALFYRGGTMLSADNRPTAIIEAPAGYSSRDYGKDWAAGDLNGDGRSDLVTTLQSDAMLHVFYGARGVDFEHDAYVPFTARSATRLATLDANADGVDDLVTACLSEAQLRFYQGPLGDAFTKFPEDEYSFGFVGGDIDGDGNDDLLMGYPFLYAGGESLLDQRLPNMLAEYSNFLRPVALADHNGDGLLDLVVGGQWFRGDGSFAPEHSVSLAYDDGDGFSFEPVSLAR